MPTTEREYPPINFHDHNDTLNEAFERYKKTGALIMDWANGINVPANIDDLRTQLAGLVDIPENMTYLEICQGDDDDKTSTTFVLRLPPKNQLNESRGIQDNNNGPYELPEIYLSAFAIGGHNEPPAADMLKARVADYTMRGCR